MENTLQADYDGYNVGLIECNDKVIQLHQVQTKQSGSPRNRFNKHELLYHRTNPMHDCASPCNDKVIQLHQTKQFGTDVKEGT